MTFAASTLASAVAWWVLTWGGYPLLLRLLVTTRPRRSPTVTSRPDDPPLVSITLCAHNAAGTLAAALERLLALDYPAHRRQLFVVSDASSDATDAVLATFVHRGVEWRRVDQRVGKTIAENLVARELRGEIVVNTDASVLVERDALWPLVRAFDDPTVGVASGHDVSIARTAATAERGTRDEAGYVGYEMHVRALESALDGTVGASGCLYAARAEVQHVALAGGFSRDFAAALIARDRGWRTVSVDAARCRVQRSGTLAQEYWRKTRTVTRGLATLWHFRRLLDPRRDSRFAFMLAAHKLARWLAPWWAVAALVSGMALAPGLALAATAVAACATGVVLRASAGPTAHGLPALLYRLASFVAFMVASQVAVLHAWCRFVLGVNPPVWEPTRRSATAQP